MVRVDEYPNLELLCWNLEAPYVARRDAFSLYERNWRLVDRDAAPEHERAFIDAEKLLAHADRGGDESTHARDLIDLAFMAGSWPAEHLRAARAIAESAYGSVVMRELGEGLSRFEDASRRRHCIEMLSIADTSTLDRGLLALKKS